MSEKENKLPNISNLKNLADFWEKHDLSDFEQEFVEISSQLNVNIKGRTYLPITIEMFEKLEGIAVKNGINVDQLIRKLLEEKIAEIQ